MGYTESLLTPFTWHRPRKDTPGLSWVDDRFEAESPMPDDCRGEFGIDRGEKRETRWLVVPEFGLQWEEYEPLRQHPELFRTFIDTEASEAGFLSFAQKYGPLGVDSSLRVGGGYHALSVGGEALEVWR